MHVHLNIRTDAYVYALMCYFFLSFFLEYCSHEEFLSKWLWSFSNMVVDLFRKLLDSYV